MKKWFAGLSVAALLLIASGCRTVVIQGNPPPPPPERVEVITVRPCSAAMWVPGHWKWQGRAHGYVWIPGHWKK